MNTKRKLNCYVFGNLIISFLTMNLVANPTSRVLVEKNSNTTLNKIYEKESLVISTPDTIIGSGEKSSVIKIGNNVKTNNTNNNYKYDYIKPSYNSVTGSNLVSYAKNFIGLRYVHAGDSLATGTDCSGFTRLIFKEFGISLGRTVSSQLYSGTYVSRDDLQPGDLVFYSYGSVASHVAIYIGNGLIIHQSTPKDGVKISSVNIMRYITARRLITSNVATLEKENVVVETVKQKEDTSKVEIKKEEIVQEQEKVVDEVETIDENNKNIETSNIDKNKKIIDTEVKEESKVEEKKEVIETSIKDETTKDLKVDDKVEIKEEVSETQNIDVKNKEIKENE